jgi:hypothetical protein
MLREERDVDFDGARLRLGHGNSEVRTKKVAPRERSLTERRNYPPWEFPVH